MPNEVRVYSDPITMKDFEGSAQVLRIYFSDDDRCWCLVRFLAGPSPRVHERWIDKPQLEAAGLQIPAERK